MRLKKRSKGSVYTLLSPIEFLKKTRSPSFFGIDYLVFFGLHHGP